MSSQRAFDFDEVDLQDLRDAEARRIATDPARNVALEASAGTGKTRVLVERYVALLLAGVDPRNILAVTFTRKAAAEMRRRILGELNQRRQAGEVTAELARRLRERAADIGISTIDAFCLALLREFPLEADVDPGFGLADETETPHLIDEALDRALRIGRSLGLDDPDVALLFADLGEFRLRAGLARLLDRRLVAADGLNRFVQRADLSVLDACTRLVARLNAAFATVPGGVENFLSYGPAHPGFGIFAHDLRALLSTDGSRPEMIQARLERVRTHLLTQKGEARKKLEQRVDEFRSRADYDRYKTLVLSLAPYVAEALEGFRADLNLVLARGVRRLFSVAVAEYRRTLQRENLLDFSEVLSHTLSLLRRMDDFSRSRFRLESRYQHVLVDEFQDTSRAQWELVGLLVRAWGEGEGPATGALHPSIFIVGDRKQSIYSFRDAEASVIDEAARYIEALRPIGPVRHAITRSFRSVREILAFVNDLFGLVEKQTRSDAFRYDERDLFPLGDASVSLDTADTPLGIATAESDEAQADAVAEEIVRLLLDGVPVRDPHTGVRRAITPGDIAMLFRTRESHRLFEAALARRAVPFYVYKGLGFFDADEIKDVLALLAYLAAPHSDLRTAASLRSRFVRLSDQALKTIAPGLAGALTSPLPIDGEEPLADDDRARLALTVHSVRGWIALTDQLSPSELLDRVLLESAYAAELRGPSMVQAQENLKKVRGLVRRIENRGYATLARVVEYLSHMVAGGDESNAIIDAADAVHVMTVHAAKGLEFPVVFVANLGKGSGGAGEPIRVSVPPYGDDTPVSVAVGEHESAADRDADAREEEEAKRLLYVALTRARDRLYLCSTLGRDAQLAAGRGSLGRVLPPVCAALFGLAATNPESVVWTGGTCDHVLRVLRSDPVLPRVLATRALPRDVVHDFAQVPLPGASRVAITALVAPPVATGADAAGAADHGRLLQADVPDEWEATPAAPVQTEGPSTSAVARLVGTLVHRALHARLEVDLAHGCSSEVELRSALDALLLDEERLSERDVQGALRMAEVTYRQLFSREEVREALAGSIAHEQAFSYRLAGGVWARGTVDCMARAADGTMTLLEVKTGVPSPQHAAQLAFYLDAARAGWNDAAVSGRLVYVATRDQSP